MVKILEGPNSRYEIAKRSFNWLKLKKDYIANLTDSFDLVPIGAFYGKGKRTGNFGAFLLACYDPESEQFQSACKVLSVFSLPSIYVHSSLIEILSNLKLGTGFSDESLAQHTQQLMQHQLKEKPPYFRYFSSLLFVFLDAQWKRNTELNVIECNDLFGQSTGETMKPDVWFEPVQVWEARCCFSAFRKKTMTK
jgi:DNA ligase-1